MKTIWRIVTAMAVMAPSALAAAPQISGTYLVTYIESCQAAISYSSTGGFVTSVNSVSPGKLTDDMGRISFNPVTHKVVGSGVQEQGDLLILKNQGGDTVKQTPWHPVGSYFNTATTINIFGASFSVIYSANPATNIVNLADFQGIPSAGCIAQGHAVRQ